MMSGEQLDMDAARISKAKRRKRVTRDMSTLKNSMLELAVKFDDNYNTGLIKSFMSGMNKTEIKIMTDILSRYKFQDSHGDLVIVKDDLLRNFMEKGTGFRLMITKNKSNVMKQIIKDLDKLYLKIAIKYGMPIEAFNQFRSYVATEIRELDFTVENEIMYKDLKSSIENIQNDFVITYVDKIVTSSTVVNPHHSIHDKCYGFTSCSRISTTPSIVPEFLRLAIVYCLNSGTEDRQTGRHNGKVEPAPH
ncbi:hypothetical protein TNCV_3236431 [Trichonephila clavipes]|nr:hypothetical protein TNCV_3236431 [Trichonephila clavipes]